MRYALSIPAIICLLSVALSAEFVDIPQTHWAKDAVSKIQSYGVTNGYPDQTFRGDKALTRYELAVYLANYDTHLQQELKDLKARCASLNEELITIKAKQIFVKP